MKFNPIVIFVSGCLVGALTLLPFGAQAEPQSPIMPLPAVLEQLNLTADQEAQLSTIRQTTRSQLEAVVSSEQREQFKTSWQQGNSLRQAIAAMNLSPEQQQQVRSIFQASRQQAAQVLNSEQKQQLRQIILSRLDQVL
jgi:Spy/CpxP family protein refolding chaperone